MLSINGVDFNTVRAQLASKMNSVRSLESPGQTPVSQEAQGADGPAATIDIDTSFHQRQWTIAKIPTKLTDYMA